MVFSTVMWPIIVPIVGVAALIVALCLARNVRRQPEGNDRMKEISAAIHEGARAFLFSDHSPPAASSHSSPDTARQSALRFRQSER